MSDDALSVDSSPATHDPRTGGVSVRAATLADVPAVAALFCEQHGGAAAETAPHIADHFELIAEGLPDYVCVAEIDSVVVGFGKCGHRAMGDLGAVNLPDGFYLAGIYTTPRFRRRGVGHHVTVHRLQWIAAHADAAFYFTDTDNEASIALHVDMGFVEVCRGVSPPPGAPQKTPHQVLFQKTLR
jgi:ribosomal protein S18 acetylase RimI-like enzyme